MSIDKLATAWRAASWILLFTWVVGAAMSMWHVHGGFLTNYLADLTFPPWYYIVTRGLTTTGKKPPFLLRWFGVSAGRTATSILLVGVASEIAQRYGLIGGTFDIWDIVAYTTGLGVCVICDRRPWSRPTNTATTRGDIEKSERLP